MPFSLPPLQTGSSIWYGPTLNNQKEKWIIYLNETEINELETALRQFQQNENTIGKMTQGDFPLPNLGKKLARLKTQLIQGIGFFLLKGLPVERYSEKEAATIFFGIGTHIGNARSQNAQGHVLGQVKNVGLDSTDPKVRLYQTQERQTFHTDSCDVVGLLCMQPAKEGGLSLLVSANTVFNEMRQRRPDLLELLLQPIATDRRGEVPEGMLPYLLIPVFSYFHQKITPFYQRQYIESAQRFADAPRLTFKHIEALDLFDELCNSPNLHLTMLLEKGDMQFVYNHAMLHDRTAFVDFEDINKRRYLARLWLSVVGDRPLPDVFASRFGSVEVGNRGGIMVKGTQLTVPWF
ncbi:MAG: TauD/TfdA family dioxygenase [Bacteroidota bacterium]